MEICSCNTRLKGEKRFSHFWDPDKLECLALGPDLARFTDKYGQRLNEPVMLEQVSIVSGGTGDIVVVKNTEEIEKLVQYFGEYKVQPDYFYNDSKTGWSYGIKFEWENKQTFITCIDTNRIKVDNKVYKVKNGDLIENSLKELFDELSE